MESNNSRDDTPIGRISLGSQPLGTPSDEDLQTRAEEIAESEGLEADQVNERHLEQARRELLGEAILPSDLPDRNVESLNPQEPVGTMGRMAPKIIPSDEELIPEQLVTEGVEDALHEEMKVADEELDEENNTE